MSKKIRVLIVHILLVAGLFFIFSGLLMPEPPIEVKQSSFIEDNTEPLSTEEIIQYEEQYEEYEPVLPGERENYIIDNYDLSEFSNETQEDLQKLVNNETTSIQSTELFEGQFIVNFGNDTSYIFEGEQHQSNPLMVSLWGYFLIIVASVLFVRIPRDDEEEENDKSSLLDDVEKAGEDSKWDYVLIDNDEKDDKK